MASVDHGRMSPAAPTESTTPPSAAQELEEMGGVATAAELRARVSRSRIAAALESGAIVKLHRSSYGLASVDEARSAAIRFGGTVSHLSAALHWGWKVKHPPPAPTITVPRHRHGVPTEGVQAYYRSLPGDAVDGGATTRVQTVVDCARDYPYDVALAVADSALRAGLSRAAILRAIESGPRTRRAPARRVARHADRRAANPFESVLRAIAEGVPGLQAVPQQWIGSHGRADLVDHRLRLVIEAESFEFHADSASFGRDVRRYTEFARAGYTVVRFTWKEVMFEPDYVRCVLLDLVALGPRVLHQAS